MPWLRFSLLSDAQHADALSALLSELGAASVTLLDDADQPLFEPPPGATPLWDKTRVTALFDANTDMTPILAALAEQVDAETLAARHIEPLEDKDWVRAWMEEYHPIACGKRLWIVPSWLAPPDPAAVNLILDPGLAFGTGTHPTTFLCMQWLDGAEVEDKIVIDYGCGSGILGIAAALLGASRVLSVDLDPQALQATRDNAARNQVEDRIEVYMPSGLPADPTRDEQAGLLLANILAGPLRELAPRLAALTRRGGDIVLSGILAEQAAQVSEAYAPWFEMHAPVEQEGWVRLHGRRHAE